MRVRLAVGATFVIAGFLVMPFSQIGRAEIPREAEQLALEEKWEEVWTLLAGERLKTDDPCVRLLLGQAGLATNRNNEALSCFASVYEEADLNQWLSWTTSLREKNPKSGVARFLHGDALARLGKLEAAEVEFSAAVEKNRRLALAFIALGTVQTLLGKVDEAVVSLNSALEIEPVLAEAQAAMGTYYVRRCEGQAEEVRKFYDRAIAINHDFALAYLGRACAFYAGGDFDEAYADLEQAMALSPEIGGLGERNETAVLAVADQYLAMVSGGGKIGATIETKTGFEYRKVTLNTNEQMDVYVVRFAANESSLVALRPLATQILNDFRGRSGAGDGGPIRIFMEGHGWKGRAEDHIDHAAVMAKSSGDRMAVVLDFPQYRFPEALKWKGSSDLAGRQLGAINAAFNLAGPVRLNYSGESGAAEAWVKQWEKAPDAREHIQWGRVWLTAYPFANPVAVPVRVSNELLARTEGVVNVHTAFGNWSNPLRGSEKLTNLPLTRGGKPYQHGSFDNLTLDNGHLNPSVWMENQWFKGVSAPAIQNIGRGISSGELFPQGLSASSLPSVQAFPSSSAKPLALPAKAFAIRQDNPLFDLTRLVSEIKNSGAGGTRNPALIVGDDSFRSALLVNHLSRLGVPAVKVPAGSDWKSISASLRSPVVAGINSDFSDLAASMKRPLLPPLPSRPQPIPVPSPSWSNFQFLKPTPILPGFTPPGGIDMSMARAFVDKGKWPVLTAFGLLYSLPDER